MHIMLDLCNYNRNLTLNMEDFKETYTVGVRKLRETSQTDCSDQNETKSIG